MDDRRFDAVTRSLANRRAAVGGLLTALLGAAVPGMVGAKKKKKQKKHKTKKCKPKCPACKKCVKGKCKRKPNGTRCGAGRTCSGGVCGPASCPGRQVLCNNACIDVTTDNANCGACGNACSVGTSCCGGSCCEGCCDGNLCRRGITPAFCGTGGTACATCAADQGCLDGTCTCGSVSCDGCCDGTACRPGDTDAHCGIHGSACVSCTATGLTCNTQIGVCDCTPQSDAATCAGKCGTVQNNCGQPIDCTALCGGCCDGGTCRPGFATQSCGKNGATCTACTNCTTCDNGVCAAGCGSCATCNGDGFCEPFADGTACGSTGGCDDGRCLRKFDNCVNDDTCSWNYSVAVDGAGLNLCLANDRATAGQCATTSDCPTGYFCAAIGAEPICAKGCPG